MIIMSLISLLWFLISAGLRGWFGVSFKRRLEWFTFDNEESERLYRIIQRYKNGEFTVQFSHYNNSIMFTKWVNGSLPTIKFPENTFYVNIAKEDSRSFGCITDEPLHHTTIENTVSIKSYKINNKAYKELVSLVKELRNEPINPKLGWWAKRKNEDVHLS